MDPEQEKSITFFRFEDLRIYHKALEYVSWLYSLSPDIQDELHTKNLFDRLIISAQGIALNIAEGSSRNKSQFVYYLKMAKSSVRECVVLSTMGHNKGLLSITNFDKSKNQLMEMTKMLGALIGSLQRTVKENDEETDEDIS